MKYLLTAAVLAFATPAEAQILGCHKQTCSGPTKPKPVKRVGRQGDCPQHRDGYCRTAHEWWDQKMLSQ
jgi:hypothetical protein